MIVYMEIFQQAELELQGKIEQYEQAITYSNLLTARIESIKSIFESVKSLLIQHFGKHKPTPDSLLLSKFESSDSGDLGITEYQKTIMSHFLIPSSRFLLYVQIFNHYITDGILDQLTQLNIDSQKKLHDGQSSLQTIQKAKQQIQRQLQKADAALRTLILQMDQNYSKYQQAKTPALEAKIQDQTLHFQEKREEIINLIQQFTEAHLSHLTEMHGQICSLRANSIMRESMIKASFHSLYPIINQCATFFQKMGPTVGEISSLWEHDFLSFVSAHRIVRTFVPPLLFKHFEFSFDDVMLGPSSPVFTGLQRPIPLRIAQICHDFEAESEGELSVHEGEYVYLYECPVSKWMMASNSRKQFGYLPSAAVKSYDMKTVLLTAPVLAVEENGMVVGASGDLLLSFDGDEYANISGQKGKIAVRSIIEI